MPGIEPLEQQRVPFDKIENAINRIVDQINRQRPIPGGGLELLPNGFMVKPQAESSGYTPPFAKVLQSVEGSSNKALSIGSGWLHSPKKDTAGDFEIPDHRQFAYKPKISGIEIDNESEIPTLTCPAGATTYIHLKLNLLQVAVRVGATDNDDVNNTGALLDMNDSTHNGDDISVSGISLHDQLTYYTREDGAFWPSFIATDSGDYDANIEDDELVAWLPFGKIVLDADGNETSESEWYVHHDYQFFPQVFIRGADTTADAGHNPLTASDMP